MVMRRIVVSTFKKQQQNVYTPRRTQCSQDVMGPDVGLPVRFETARFEAKPETNDVTIATNIVINSAARGGHNKIFGSVIYKTFLCHFSFQRQNKNHSIIFNL